MSQGALEIAHDRIQGHVCPRITFSFSEEGGLSGETRRYLYRGFKGGMSIIDLGTNIQLLNWTYDHIGKDWRPPVYATQSDIPGQDEYIRGLVGRLLTRVHEILDSDEAIEYFASLLPDTQELDPAEARIDYRSPFAKVLGVLSSHLKADEASSTRNEYLARRRSSLIGRQPAQPAHPLAAAAAARSFRPDLTNLPP